MLQNGQSDMANAAHGLLALGEDGAGVIGVGAW